MNTPSSDIYDFGFHKCRNISSPDDDAVGRRVYSGSAPARSVIGLEDNENVREYLVDAKGKQKKSPTLVHQAMRKSLRETPETFGVLNSGTVIVARGAEVDDKNRQLKLIGASIINGSQTRGELKRYFESRSPDEISEPSIKFEIIVTDDDDLIAEISISRNFQNDVKPISIAGRRGQLDELEKSIQSVEPSAKLRKSESDLLADDNFVDTEKVIQATFALLPESLSPPHGMSLDLSNKVFAYSQKTRCLKIFQKLADEPDSDMYRAFLGVAPLAWSLYRRWKSHQGFIGTNIRSIERDNGRVLEVPDGIVFPIVAAHAAFVYKAEAGWQLGKPSQLSDEEIISVAKQSYMEIAGHNPQTMGKSKACYTSLMQITSIYAKLLRNTL
ncbi:AIPR family protein [Tritonibacter mobilis]|uniref:AIPR family protein n=1 Tax=Tritonibacter mobilis TaxID=379347 RepID=UPI001C08A9FB|nr:AIPR family protein [Tritonibacter mobilis]MBU3034254.1 AIPR family protein [Tritonibacter mobilis]WHQ84307.1 AIPR family protein [Tritonibacter mobilis]